MTARSNAAEVRNPLLQLPAGRALKDLPPEAKRALDALLRDMKADAATRAQQCWVKHKAPMATYWKAVAVYAGHTRRALRAAS